jgi:hypothetical protein
MGWPGTPTLASYLDGLHQLALEFPNFALVVFDIKEDACNPDYGFEILTAIRQRLTHNTNVKLVLSVAKDEHAVTFDRIQGMLGPREGLMVDAENDPGWILTMFNARGVANQGYGNGITPDNLVLGPYYRYTLEAACAFKAQLGVPKFVISWTNNTKHSIR